MLRSVFNWWNKDQNDGYLKLPRILPEGAKAGDKDVYYSHEFADPKTPWKRVYMAIESCSDGWIARKYISDQSTPEKPAVLEDASAAGHPNQVLAAIAGFEKECRRVKMIEIPQSPSTCQDFASKFGFFLSPEGKLIEVKRDKVMTAETTMDEKTQKALFSKGTQEVKNWHDLYRVFDARMAKHLEEDPEAMTKFASLPQLYKIAEEMKDRMASFIGGYKTVKETPHLAWMKSSEITGFIIDWHWADRLPPLAHDVYVASGLVAYLRAGGQAFNACVSGGMKKKDIAVMDALKDEAQAVARNMGLSDKQIGQVTDLFVGGQDHMAPQYPFEILMKKALDMRAELEVKWAEERRIAEEKRIQGLREAAEAFMKPIKHQLCLPPGKSDDPNGVMRINRTHADGTETERVVHHPVATMYAYGLASATFTSVSGRKYTLNNKSDKINASIEVNETDSNVSVSVTQKNAVPASTRTEPAQFAADTGDISAEITAEGKVVFSGTLKQPKKRSGFKDGFLSGLGLR